MKTLFDALKIRRDEFEYFYDYMKKIKELSNLENYIVINGKKAELTEEQLKDPLFVQAYQKYNDIQEADPILILIKTAQRTLYKTRVFLDNIDFNEDVDETGRPLYKPKDVIADIASIAKMRIQLQELEEDYKSSLGQSSDVRGGVEIGFDEI